MPEKWYELYEHRGYTVGGKQVIKLPQKDELEKFMERQNDKEWWTKIFDAMNNKDVKLSRADLEMIKRIRRGTYAEKSMDPFPDFDHYETEKLIHPLGGTDEPKRRFVASKWERLKVSKFIRAMQKGWMKTMAELEEEER